MTRGLQLRLRAAVLTCYEAAPPNQQMSGSHGALAPFPKMLTHAAQRHQGKKAPWESQKTDDQESYQIVLGHI